MFYWRQPPWNILDFLIHGNSDKTVPLLKLHTGATQALTIKENGGLDASDYISIHSRKHMYDPDTVSTPKKTQYGKDVNVGKLCEDTIMKPDEVIYNKDQNVMIYKKEYKKNYKEKIGSGKQFHNVLCLEQSERNGYKDGYSSL